MRRSGGLSRRRLAYPLCWNPVDSGNGRPPTEKNAEPAVFYCACGRGRLCTRAMLRNGISRAGTEKCVCHEIVTEMTQKHNIRRLLSGFSLRAGLTETKNTSRKANKMTMKTKTTFTTLTALASAVTMASADMLISQYVETDSGTHPKGIELWNSGSSAIDFSVDGLDVLKGTNGSTPSSVFTLNTGSLGAGEVLVIGSDDTGDPLADYMSTNFPNVDYFVDGNFNHNGDDSFQVEVGSVLQDTFGDPGTDPGTSWDGNGVSTSDQNIALLEGITSGTTTGFTDPSTRFETVSTEPSLGGSELSGFGVAPVPEPGSYALLAGLSGLFFVMLRRRRS